MPEKNPLLTVMICPSVTSWARPRPAVISTSVAMIGWIPRRATRNPFHAPSATASASASPMPASAAPGLAGSGLPAIHVQATAPEIATTAPTDRSIPRVAITSVIPSAVSASGAPLCRMSTRLP